MDSLLVLDRFQRSLEEYKSELSKSLETHKQSLAIEAHGKNLELTRVDAKRSVAVAAIWGRFLQWNDAYEYLIDHVRQLDKDPEGTASSRDELQRCNEKIDALYESSKRLSEEVKSQSIYFDSEQYGPFLEGNRRISELCSEFHKSLYGKYASEKKMKAKLFVSGLSNASKQLRTELTANNDELRRTFHRSLRAANRSLTHDLGEMHSDEEAAAEGGPSPT